MSEKNLDLNQGYVKLCIDQEGDPAFAMRIVNDDTSKSRMDFEVWQITGWDINEAEKNRVLVDQTPYVTGSIKWDGCSHLNFRQYMHLCGKSYFDLHCQLLQELFAYAASSIEFFDKEIAS